MIAASIAPTARPYLKPDDAPCFAFDQSTDWFVPINEVANGGDVDALFGTDADDRNVDRIDELRRGAVGDLDDSQSAADAWIDA